MNIIVQILEQFSINQTFFIMLGLFVITFVFMNFVALKPLTNAIVERENRIDGRELEVQKLQRELGQIKESLVAETNRARRDANSAFLEMKAKALAEQKSILDKARATSQAEIRSARASIVEKTGSEMRKLESEVPGLAKMIVEQILGGRGRSQNSAASLEA
jgi:F0F1-type ATP synthase membrane subunit b/b'